MPHRDHDAVGVGRAISAVPIAPIADPSFPDVLNALNTSRARTVNEGVAAIAAAFPNFVSEYTLVYDSFSVQKASFLKPRAIVYGREARTIVTFNGEAADGGRGAIEMASFVEGRGHEFREIAFAAETPTDERLDPGDVDPRFSNERFQVSRANIGKCTQCHTMNNPIWDNYPLWAGVYGSFDDALFQKLSSKTSFIPVGPNIEETRYDEYLRRRSGRYLNLPTRPRSNYETIEFFDYSHRPNLKLSLLLSRDVFKKFAYAVVRARPPEQMLKSLLATIACPSSSPVSPNELWQTIAEDGPAVLENVRRMQAIFAPATFSPNPNLYKPFTDTLRRAFPGVSENDLGLIEDLTNFGFVSNLNYRARKCGVDPHVGFANRARTSNNGGGNVYVLFDAMISVLIQTQYPGDWQAWADALKNDPGRACSLSDKI